MKKMKFVVALVCLSFCTALLVETAAEIVIPAKKTPANKEVVSYEIVIPAKK